MNTQKTNLIPKRIFYVWFGAEKPAQVNICIQNWRTKLPDYEIIEINEHSPYFDFAAEYQNCRWFKIVYDRKMWAYVADYVRCKVLYDHGGIYLDTDITIEKDLSPLLSDSFFIGEEKEGLVAVGVFGCQKRHPLLKRMLEFYETEIFSSPLYTMPSIITEMLQRHHYEDIKIYPRQYFYPFYPFAPHYEKWTPQCVKKQTYTVHWWNASWFSDETFYFLENKHKPEILEQMLNNTLQIKTIDVYHLRLFKIIPVLKIMQEGQESRIFLFDILPLLKIKKNKLYWFFIVPFMQIQHKEKTLPLCKKQTSDQIFCENV